MRNFISIAYSCRFMSINFVSSQFVQWVVFFQFKYICNRKIIPVRIAHKSYTLRQALSHTSKERKCTRDKCLISNTGLCLRRNAVYQLTCNSCDQHYIGSTTRFIYDRMGEHINNENSSVKKTYLFLPEQRLQRHWRQDYFERKSTSLWRTLH